MQPGKHPYGVWVDVFLHQEQQQQQLQQQQQYPLLPPNQHQRRHNLDGRHLTNASYNSRPTSHPVIRQDSSSAANDSFYDTSSSSSSNDYPKKHPVQESRPSSFQFQRATNRALSSSSMTSSGDTETPGESLMDNLEREIYHAAKEVAAVSPPPDPLTEGVGGAATNSNVPFDPNLVCPRCHLQFRIGEIQKFKKHVDRCQAFR